MVHNVLKFRRIHSVIIRKRLLKGTGMHATGTQVALQMIQEIYIAISLGTCMQRCFRMTRMDAFRRRTIDVQVRRMFGALRMPLACRLHIRMSLLSLTSRNNEIPCRNRVLKQTFGVPVRDGSQLSFVIPPQDPANSSLRSGRFTRGQASTSLVSWTAARKFLRRHQCNGHRPNYAISGTHTLINMCSNYFGRGSK